MLYLYHGTTSVCAAKVRLALSEKSLPWDGEILDLQRGDQHKPEYRRLNPNSVVPTLIHDGKVVIETTLIARLWMKKIDDHLHPACSTVSFAVAFRHGLLKKTPEELEARFASIPDLVYRERQRLSVMHGVEAPHVPPALRYYDQYFGEMEEALSRSPYLVGESYSLADLAVTSYVVRAEMLAMDGMWAKRPHIADWYRRIRKRPSFEPGIAVYLTPTERQRFDIPREETWSKIQRVLAK